MREATEEEMRFMGEAKETCMDCPFHIHGIVVDPDPDIYFHNEIKIECELINKEIIDNTIFPEWCPLRKE